MLGPPTGGTFRRRSVAHTQRVPTFDNVETPTATRGSSPHCEGASAIGFPQPQSSREPNGHTFDQRSDYLPMATAQLIEAAYRARDGDSHGAREHVTRAMALLNGHSQPNIAAKVVVHDCARIPRGGFAAWQSQRLAAHVDSNLSCKIVIKELAGSLDISVGHFCRAFKRTFGMPARIWIRRRRIEFAQVLMLTTRASLSEIALSCGMSDQSHFTRSFRRIVGEAPSIWRQTRRGAIEERATQLAYPGNVKPFG